MHWKQHLVFYVCKKTIWTTQTPKLQCSLLHKKYSEFMGFLHVTGHQPLTFSNFTNSSKFIIIKIQSKETNSLNIEYLSFRQWPIVSWKSLEFYWISVKFVITDPVICPYISQFFFLFHYFFPTLFVTYIYCYFMHTV